MAGSGELLEVPRFTLKEVSGALERVKGKELDTQLFVANIENRSGEPLDLEMEVAAITNLMKEKLMMGKAKHSAGGDKLLIILNDGEHIYTVKMVLVTDEIQKKLMDKSAVDEDQTKKMCEAAVDEVQTKKMGKSPVDEIQKEKKDKATVVTGKAPVTIYEVLDHTMMDKAPVEAVAATDKIQPEKMMRKAMVVEALEALFENAIKVLAMDKNQTERSKALVEALETGEAQVKTGKMDKALVEAGTAAIDEIRMEMCKALVAETGETLVETGKKSIAIDKNQTEMSKALVESLETREGLVETGKEAERCAESDVPAGVDGEFVPLLNWVPGEVFDNIFLEVDEEDEEILNRIAEAEEFSRGLWDDWVKKRPADMQFADPSDPDCPVAV